MDGSSPKDGSTIKLKRMANVVRHGGSVPLGLDPPYPQQRGLELLEAFQFTAVFKSCLATRRFLLGSWHVMPGEAHQYWLVARSIFSHVFLLIENFLPPPPPSPALARKGGSVCFGIGRYIILKSSAARNRFFKNTASRFGNARGSSSALTLMRARPQDCLALMRFARAGKSLIAEISIDQAIPHAAATAVRSVPSEV